MDRQRIEECKENYLAAAAALADERTDYAGAWQLNRFKSKSDWEATQKTIEETKDSITLHEARLFVARKELEFAYAESKENR